MHPETRYARNGDIHLAYQVFGEGDIDILWMPGWVWQIEHIWEEPRARRMFDRLAQIGRVIIFDRRGFGLSERVPDVPTLEEQIDDALTVLDTVGARSVAVLSSTDTAPVSLMFAASQPARVEALVLFSPIASHVQTEDIPWATSPERRAKAYQRHAETWGTGAYASMFAPSLASDERIRRWFGTLERLSATPSVLQRVIRASSEIDIRASLGAIRTPTLILNRRDDKVVNPNHARYLAERIPSAKHVELPGTDTLLLAGDIDRAFDEIQEFLTGAPPVREVERTLATVLFTDIVDSTRRAAELGDRRWRALLEEHDARIRRQLAAHRGREIKTIGDGFLATFDGPARAHPVRAADPRRRQRARGGRARRHPHRRDRAARRRHRRDRGQHRRARRIAGGAQRGARVPDGEGSGGRLRPGVHRPGQPRAQGRPGRVAPVQGRRLTGRRAASACGPGDQGRI
jgi:pimeloyl-ACP methyl ester carboxylesterase